MSKGGGRGVVEANEHRASPLYWRIRGSARAGAASAPRPLGRRAQHRIRPDRRCCEDGACEAIAAPGRAFKDEARTRRLLHLRAVIRRPRRAVSVREELVHHVVVAHGEGMSGVVPPGADGVRLPRPELRRTGRVHCGRGGRVSGWVPGLATSGCRSQGTRCLGSRGVGPTPRISCRRRTARSVQGRQRVSGRVRPSSGRAAGRWSAAASG